MPHTQGPWKVGRSARRDPKILSIRSDSIKGTIYVISEVTHYDRDMTEDEWQSNARLIAAAPEMLEALKIAYKVSLKYSTIECGMRSSDVDWVSMAKNFKSIIDKAEGKDHVPEA